MARLRGGESGAHNRWTPNRRGAADEEPLLTKFLPLDSSAPTTLSLPLLLLLLLSSSPPMTSPGVLGALLPPPLPPATAGAELGSGGGMSNSEIGGKSASEPALAAAVVTTVEVSGSAPAPGEHSFWDSPLFSCKGPSQQGEKKEEGRRVLGSKYKIRMHGTSVRVSSTREPLRDATEKAVQRGSCRKSRGHESRRVRSSSNGSSRSVARWLRT